MFGIVSQAKRVQARMKALALLNLELAKVEGKRRRPRSGSPWASPLWPPCSSSTPSASSSRPRPWA